MPPTEDVRINVGDESLKKSDEQTPSTGKAPTRLSMIEEEAGAKTSPPFVASVDFGENYYDLFVQNRTLFEFKTPKPSKYFQQPREVPRPVVLGAVGVFEKFVQRAVYEVFSIVRFVFALVVVLLTETLKLIVRGLVQPLIVGFITIMGSHFLQPVLVSVFNYILQPYLSFVNNVLSMLQQTLQPWFMMVGHLLGKIADVLRAIRLVEISTVSHQPPAIFPNNSASSSGGNKATGHHQQPHQQPNETATSL